MVTCNEIEESRPFVRHYLHFFFVFTDQKFIFSWCFFFTNSSNISESENKTARGGEERLFISSYIAQKTCTDELKLCNPHFVTGTVVYR